MAGSTSAKTVLPFGAPPPTAPGAPAAQTSQTQQSTPASISQLPVWLFRPPDGQSFDFAASVGIPAIGAAAVIVVSFTVPNGYNGIINRIANQIVGGAFTDGSGALVWQIATNMNNPGSPIIAPNYNAIISSLGATQLPSEISGIPIRQAQLVALLVKNVSVVAAGQIITGRLGGFFYPVQSEPTTTGF